MSYFKNLQKQNVSPRAFQEHKYETARVNMILMVVLTLVNIVLAFASDASSYFLFSAYTPYSFVVSGLYLCGKLPAEWYEGDVFEFYDTSFLVIYTAIAAIILALYFLCWLMSKEHKGGGWMIFALVLFSLDTLDMLGDGIMLDFSGIIDILFHAWVIYYLVVGIIAAKKLKTLPEETPADLLPPDLKPEGAGESAPNATPDTPAEVAATDMPSAEATPAQSAPAAEETAEPQADTNNNKLI